jgi:hypothetical protein
MPITTYITVVVALSIESAQDGAQTTHKPTQDLETRLMRCPRWWNQQNVFLSWWQIWATWRDRRRSPEATIGI